MNPVIAIIGRPNVGKSTLFNRLTGTRNALVADMPGVTRDRLYGKAEFYDTPFIVIDTGGLSGENQQIENLMEQQVFQAVFEADIVFFLLDGRSGLTGYDEIIAKKIRTLNKQMYVLVNKSEGMPKDVIRADFFSLGLGEPIAISAAHGQGINELMRIICDDIEPFEFDAQTEDDDSIHLAIIGRPNVGKSTLINRLMGEDRVVSFDMPGTTRDSVFIPFTRGEQKYTFIDTAGVRKRSKVKDVLEKFSAIKALQAIDAANVVVLMIDANEGITDQDLTLLGMVHQAGKGLLLAINKWDGLSPDHRQMVKNELDRRLNFMDYASVHYISALHGSGVGLMYDTIERAYFSAMKQFSASKLTRYLEQAVSTHQPPAVHGRMIKMVYAHQGGKNPPLIVIHGRQVDKVPSQYTRYLVNFFRKQLKLDGTPIHIHYKQSDNPFAGIKRKDNRTEKQLFKRRRHTKQLKKKYSRK